MTQQLLQASSPPRAASSCVKATLCSLNFILCHKTSRCSNKKVWNSFCEFPLNRAIRYGYLIGFTIFPSQESPQLSLPSWLWSLPDSVAASDDGISSPANSKPLRVQCMRTAPATVLQRPPETRSIGHSPVQHPSSCDLDETFAVLPHSADPRFAGNDQHCINAPTHDLSAEPPVHRITVGRFLGSALMDGAMATD